MKNAEAAYAKASPTYGAAAEAIGSAGLTGSGYAEYLSAAAEKQRQNALAAAEEGLAARRASLSDSYKEYLENYRKEQEKTYLAVTSKIASGNSLNYEAAYRYARGAGLSEEDARRAAGYGVSSAERRIRSSAARYIFSHHLTAAEARTYARGLGLSDEAVSLLADYADRVLKQRMDLTALYTGMSAEEYLNFLRNTEGLRLF